MKVRSAAPKAVAAPAPGPIPEKRIPERVTPWLLRRVKTPVTRATQPAPAPASQKASTDNIKGGTHTPKPEPPAYYHAVPQKQVYPSQERLVRTPTPTARGPATVVVQTVPVPREPPKQAAVVHRPATSTFAAKGGGETQKRAPTPTPSRPSCPQIRSVRSAPQEERPRPSRPATRAPLRPVAVTVQPERRVLLPSYHSAEPFPSSPAPPPYRASAEDSYPTSVRSRSLPRSSRKHAGGPTFEKEAAPLPPLPSHPLLSSSAISRIQAGHKVSKEFGDAIMKQELRLATPTSDHSTRLDPVPNPRLRQRFVSASELQSHRRAKLNTDKIAPEQEARLRTLNNKSSPNVGRCAGDSRQRTASAHQGRGQDKVLQRGRR